MYLYQVTDLNTYKLNERLTINIEIKHINSSLKIGIKKASRFQCDSHPSIGVFGNMYRPKLKINFIRANLNYQKQYKREINEKSGFCWGRESDCKTSPLFIRFSELQSSAVNFRYPLGNG